MKTFVIFPFSDKKYIHGPNKCKIKMSYFKSPSQVKIAVLLWQTCCFLNFKLLAIIWYDQTFPPKSFLTTKNNFETVSVPLFMIDYLAQKLCFWTGIIFIGVYLCVSVCLLFCISIISKSSWLILMIFRMFYNFKKGPIFRSPQVHVILGLKGKNICDRALFSSSFYVQPQLQIIFCFNS